MPETYRLTVGPVVREDWQSRQMAAVCELDGPDQANPYAKFMTSATADLDPDELSEVIADSEWYSDPDGPGVGNANLRAAYRRVYRNARALVRANR